MKTKEKVEQGKGTTDHLMPLGYLLLLDSKNCKPWPVCFRNIRSVMNKLNHGGVVEYLEKSQEKC